MSRSDVARCAIVADLPAFVKAAAWQAGAFAELKLRATYDTVMLTSVSKRICGVAALTSATAYSKRSYLATVR